MEPLICSKALQHPFTAIVSGPTQSGKTEWVIQLLDNAERSIFPIEDIAKIIYCYGEKQTKIDNALDRFQIRFPTCKVIQIQGLPSKEKILFNNDDQQKLLILDDLMEDAQQSEFVMDLFTRGSHHNNLSVILISQNLFLRGRHQRTISLNACYIVVMKNPRDMSQIIHLGRQILPHQWQLVQQAYEMAVKKPHGYLFIDLRQSTDDRFRFRTNIFGENGQPCTVFVAPEATNEKAINRSQR